MPIKHDTKEPEYSEGGRSDRERQLEESRWSVDLSNYREIGEVIASFTRLVGTGEFFGIAEMSIEDGVRKLELTLCYNEEEKFRCSVCQKIPRQPTTDNPGICAHCGWKVCSQCARGHERRHWRPQKTIGGNLLCNGTTVRCGKDQCPVCHGSPF